MNHFGNLVNENLQQQVVNLCHQVHKAVMIRQQYEYNESSYGDTNIGELNWQNYLN